MVLFLDPEAARRDAGGEAIARADFLLPGAADLRGVLDDAYGHPRGGPPAAKSLDRGQRCIGFNDVVVAHLADHRTAAEIKIDPLKKRSELLDTLRPQLYAMRGRSHIPARRADSGASWGAW